MSSAGNPQRRVGIDEAGYGPLLGPLTIGASVWQLADAQESRDFWQLLDEVVARPGRAERARLVVGDSKAVFHQAGGIWSLERPVLAFASAAGLNCERFTTLLSGLGVDLHAAGAERSDMDQPLPLDAARSAYAAAAGALSAVQQTGPLRLERLALRVVTPPMFNQRVRQTHNKSAVLMEQVLGLVDWATRLEPRLPTRIVVDRQGGRADYRRELLRAFPEFALTELEVGPRRSAYRMDGPRGCWSIEFVVDADAEHLPVALASMLAKYVRELYMDAFNRYWTGRVPGVKPTAGYPNDAQRFLSQIAEAIAAEGVPRESLVRSR